MIQPTNIYQVTTDLENYLSINNYFDEALETVVNQQVLALWDAKFKSAIIADIESKFSNVEVHFLSSLFELTSEAAQGACLFSHKVNISDKEESIKAYIKTLVNYNKTTIYLDSSFAMVNEWQGQSITLKLIFDKLKSADKLSGYFNPITLTELLK